MSSDKNGQGGKHSFFNSCCLQRLLQALGVVGVRIAVPTGKGGKTKSEHGVHGADTSVDSDLQYDNIEEHRKRHCWDLKQVPPVYKAGALTN